MTETKVKRRKDNRREQILDAAAHCFSRAGYEGTSVRDISTTAGILPGSMYYHFASKEELLGAVHDEGLRKVKSKVIGAIAEESDPWARFEAACTAHLEALHAAKEYGSVIATEFPRRHSKQLRARMIAERNGYEDIFRDLIDALPLRPGVSRKYLRLAVIGAMAWSLVWFRPGEDGVDEIAKQMVNLFRAAKDG
ncbi:MAG: HTH-type transcriptional repressor KstR2 [Alphaproteobacteria bacterium MarineAlpha10_Bin1]|nr:MAG: HTH-type transcriptional repressor KstR2 [Alphaproteobacteria bacterium MarineAlpha10_Bin1]